MATRLVQIEQDQELKQRLAAERARLRQQAGLSSPSHFHRPVERAFTAEERNRVTILFGGFTWKHEDLIRAVFQGCGYRCEKLPVPTFPHFRSAKRMGITASATHPISPSATWCSTCSSWRRKVFLARTFWISTSSLPLALAVPAASA